MSDPYTLFGTPEDRDLSRAAAERFHLIQAVRENPRPSRSASRRRAPRFAWARAQA